MIPYRIPVHHALHQIWKRCLDCLRLKLKVLCIMQMISSFTWGRRVLGERGGRDRHDREGQAKSSAQVQHHCACPRDGGVYGQLHQETSEWEEAKPSTSMRRRLNIKTSMDSYAMPLGRKHLGQVFLKDRFPRGYESPEIMGYGILQESDIPIV